MIFFTLPTASPLSLVRLTSPIKIAKDINQTFSYFKKALCFFMKFRREVRDDALISTMLVKRVIRLKAYYMNANLIAGARVS